MRWQQRGPLSNAGLCSAPVQSTAEYRRLLEPHGLIKPDQHVCHIIATANGGADHPANYSVFSQAYNTSTKHLHDDLTCYLVGEATAKEAVEASRRYGNKEGKKYKGPDGAILFANGKLKHKLMLK